MNYLRAIIPLFLFAVALHGQPVDTTNYNFSNIPEPEKPIKGPLFFEDGFKYCFCIPESKPEFPGGCEYLGSYLQRTIRFPRYYIDRDAIVRLEVTCLVSAKGKVIDVSTKVLGKSFQAGKKTANAQLEEEGMYLIRNQVKQVLINFPTDLQPKHNLAGYAYSALICEVELNCIPGGKLKPNKKFYLKPTDLVIIESPPTLGSNTAKALNDSITKNVPPPALLAGHTLQWEGVLYISSEGVSTNFWYAHPKLFKDGVQVEDLKSKPEYVPYNQWGEAIINYIESLDGWQPATLNGYKGAGKVEVNLCIGNGCN